MHYYSEKHIKTNKKISQKKMVKTFRMIGLALSVCALVLGATSCKDDDEEDDSKKVSNTKDVEGKYYKFSEETIVDGKSENTETFKNQNQVMTIISLEEGKKVTFATSDGDSKTFTLSKYNQEISYSTSTELDGKKTEKFIKFLTNGNVAIIKRTTVKVGGKDKVTEVISNYQKIGSIQGDESVDENDVAKETSVTLAVGKKAYFKNIENGIEGWIFVTKATGEAGTKVVYFDVREQKDSKGGINITLGDATGKNSYLYAGVIEDGNSNPIRSMSQADAFKTENVKKIIFYLDGSTDEVVFNSPTLKEGLKGLGGTETLFSKAQFAE